MPVTEAVLREMLGHLSHQRTDVDTAVFTLKSLGLRLDPEPLVLPTSPGTVIAIGSWWFMKNRPWTNSEGVSFPDSAGWFMLPADDDVTLRSMKRASFGFAAGVTYDDETVVAEAEAEGGFTIIAKPVTS